MAQEQEEESKQQIRIYANQCMLCVRRISPFELCQQHLFDRYFDHFNFYFSKAINEILANVQSATVVRYKDLLFWGDENEYLKRFYTAQEVPPRMAILTDFFATEYVPAQPLCITTSAHSIMQKRRKKQNRLFFKKAQQQQQLQQLQEQQQQQQLNTQGRIQDAGEVQNTPFRRLLQLSNNSFVQSICYSSNPYLNSGDSSIKQFAAPAAPEYSYATELHDIYNATLNSCCELQKGSVQVQHSSVQPPGNTLAGTVMLRKATENLQSGKDSNSNATEVHDIYFPQSSNISSSSNSVQRNDKEVQINPLPKGLKSTRKQFQRAESALITNFVHEETDFETVPRGAVTARGQNQTQKKVVRIKTPSCESRAINENARRSVLSQQQLLHNSRGKEGHRQHTSPSVRNIDSCLRAKQQALQKNLEKVVICHNNSQSQIVGKLLKVYLKEVVLKKKQRGGGTTFAALHRQSRGQAAQNKQQKVRPLSVDRLYVRLFSAGNDSGGASTTRKKSPQLQISNSVVSTTLSKSHSPQSLSQALRFKNLNPQIQQSPYSVRCTSHDREVKGRKRNAVRTFQLQQQNNENVLTATTATTTMTQQNAVAISPKTVPSTRGLFLRGGPHNCASVLSSRSHNESQLGSNTSQFCQQNGLILPVRAANSSQCLALSPTSTRTTARKATAPVSARVSHTRSPLPLQATTTTTTTTTAAAITSSVQSSSVNKTKTKGGSGSITTPLSSSTRADDLKIRQKELKHNQHSLKKKIQPSQAHCSGSGRSSSSGNVWQRDANLYNNNNNSSVQQATAASPRTASLVTASVDPGPPQKKLRSSMALSHIQKQLKISKSQLLHTLQQQYSALTGYQQQKQQKQLTTKASQEPLKSVYTPKINTEFQRQATPLPTSQKTKQKQTSRKF